MRRVYGRSINKIWLMVSQESGFYYLQSRYYDPSIGQFINADCFITTGQGFTGYNMFAYCLNNPVMYIDSSGTFVLAATLTACIAWTVSNW